MNKDLEDFAKAGFAVLFLLGVGVGLPVLLIYLINEGAK